jgi:hypothetical protein
MDKKITILVCFFSALTLIASVISSALIFYSEQARTEANSNKVLATNNVYKSTSIVYNQNNTFNLSGLKPGDNLTHTFSITNNNSNTIKYRIEWNNITSTWGDEIDGVSHPEEFTYTLTCSNGEAVKQTTMPTKKETITILDNLEIKTNKTNDCTLRVEFKNIGVDQSYNNNKSFRGTYKIVVIE